MIAKQTKIQLLVDGELSHGDRSSFLKTLADDDWKSVAIAFVEQQVFHETLGNGIQVGGEPSSPHANTAKLGQHGFEIPSGNTPRPKSNPIKFNPVLSFGLVLASLVAGVLIGVFGFAGSGEGTPDGHGRRTALVGGVDPFETNSDAHLDAHSNANSNANSSAETKRAYSLSEAMARSTLPIPTGFRREMLKAGYLVSENRETATVDLPIGGSVEIPIRTIEIEFLGLAAYQ